MGLAGRHEGPRGPHLDPMDIAPGSMAFHRALCVPLRFLRALHEPPSMLCITRDAKGNMLGPAFIPTSQSQPSTHHGCFGLSKCHCALRAGTSSYPWLCLRHSEKQVPFTWKVPDRRQKRTTGEKWWEVSSYDGVGRMRPLEGQEDPVKLVPEVQGSSCTVNARPSLGTHC